jgi:mono/diheme cytochrome c family protein
MYDHRLALRFSGALAAALLFLSPGRAADPLAESARRILQSHCAGCHSTAAPAKGGFDYILDRDRLVARGQVMPGKPDESPLYQRVRQGEMPPAKKPPVPAEELAVLERWIKAGAPGVIITTPAAEITTAEMYRRIRADLEQMDPRRRRFVRYLSLAHLHNAHLQAEDMQRQRHALAKLVNALSWHPRISKPQPIDEEHTLYRLDLRDYRWTARTWDRLTASYPYRLGDQNDVVKSIASLTGSEVPVVRGDWFTATASRPPLYHDFLQLPLTDRGLERLVQVDVPADLQEDNAVRAGFNGSGVARNNRLIERHDALHGAYWRSYDFSENTGRQNLFENPLGPSAGSHSFQHAGGEIIFNLPNGLHGYMLVDGAGRRIDKAPGDVVSDPKRPDRQVETGVSCLSCHAKGFLPKDDQVRAHVLKNPNAFSKGERETILALYAPPARMKALMDEDNERFARALAQAGVPPGEPEPVESVVLRFEGVLDITSAASELGLKPADLEARLRKSSDLVRTLGALLARGGTVQRQLWEEQFPGLVRTFGLERDAGPNTVANAVPFSGHTGAIRAVACSADGKRIASAGEDRTVRIWETSTGKELLRLEGHADEVLCVAFSKDGRSLISGGRDRTARVWDAASGKPITVLRGHIEAVRCVALSADGRLAASGGDDRTLRLWNAVSGQEKRALAGHAGIVHAVAFSSDGKLVLSGGVDPVVHLWDAASGEERGRWQGHTGTVHAVAFSGDGKRAVTGGSDRTVRLWDVAAGQAVCVGRGHANTVVAVALAPDGKQLLSASSRYRTADRIARVWDAAGGQERASADTEALERIECAAILPDGRSVILGGDGRLVLLPIAANR